LIGHVKDVVKREGELYKSATVKISVDYSRVEEVLCIE